MFYFNPFKSLLHVLIYKFNLSSANLILFAVSDIQTTLQKKKKNYPGKILPACFIVSRNHRMRGAGRDLCGSSSPTPLPSRDLTHGIPPSMSLKSPKLAFLKSKIVILLSALPPPQRILNFTISWSLQPRLPPTSPFLLVTTRPSNTPFLIGFSTTCVKRLSSMLFRNHCVHLAVLSFQQISGWLKPPMRTKAYIREATFSCLLKASSTFPSWSGGL